MYYKLSEYFRSRFNCRVRRISLDAGFTCPNRDGTKGNTGCVYCKNEGFSRNTRIPSDSLDDQIVKGMTGIRERFGDCKFMAYFQAFTNTYAPIEVLREKYGIIRKYKDIVALDISTRPDCIDHEKLGLIDSFTADYDVWLEYGLQSMHDKTLTFIKRAHNLEDFLKAFNLTRRMRKIRICVHVILGLPGENKEDMMKTAELLYRLKVDGVKLHPLHVVRRTELAKLHKKGEYKPLSVESYAEYCADFIKRLSPDTVIHRLTADCPKDLLIAPEWIHNKQQVTSLIEKHLSDKGGYQGSYYEK